MVAAQSWTACSTNTLKSRSSATMSVAWSRATWTLESPSPRSSS